MPRRSKWTYEINGLNIVVSYELDDKIRLILVKISPLYPYEAEIISSILGGNLEWSYDEERREVILLAGAPPLYFDELGELKRSLLGSLLRAVPSLQRIAGLDHLCGILRSREWIVIKERGLLQARKFMAKHHLTVEVKIAERGPGLSHVQITLTAFPRDLRDVRILDAKLKAAGVSCQRELSYPLYRRLCNLGEKFNWEIPPILEEMLQKITK